MKYCGGQFDSGCSFDAVRKDAAQNALLALERYRRVMHMPEGKDLRGYALDAALACLREDVEAFE
jgi:hypothetical protein